MTMDDGHTQRVTVKKGIKASDVTVQDVVTLQPYRTFLEIDQPEGNFIFRLRQQNDSLPTAALFEADSGLWKLEAVKRIKTWLYESTFGFTSAAQPGLIVG